MSLYNSLLASKLNALTGYHKEKENVPVLLLMLNNVVLSVPFKSTRRLFHETLSVSASGRTHNPAKETQGNFKLNFHLTRGHTCRLGLQ